MVSLNVLCGCTRCSGVMVCENCHNEIKVWTLAELMDGEEAERDARCQASEMQRMIFGHIFCSPACCEEWRESVS